MTAQPSPGTVRVLRRGPRAHDGPCGHCRICGKEPDESSMTHPKEGSLKSLNELLMRKNIVPEHDPVRRGQCLCTSVNCGYHMWRHRFEEGKNHTPPNASTTEAASRPPPRAVWDKCYNADTDRVGKHRCLTHLRVVEALLQHVLIEASASVLDCCGGMHDAVAVSCMSGKLAGLRLAPPQSLLPIRTCRLPHMSGPGGGTWS